jgi:hypothetical protein
MNGAAGIATVDTADARSASRSSALGAAAFILVFAIAGVALVAPLWLLLVSPLILGVPHVAADFRVLGFGIRGSASRLLLVGIAIPLAALVIRRAAIVAGWIDATTQGVQLEVAIGVCALLIAALATPSTPLRRGLIFPILVGVGAWACVYPRDAMLALGHLHNFVALALVVAFTAEVATRGRRASFLALCVIVALLLASGPAVTTARGAWLDSFAPAAFDWDSLEAALAPGLAADLAPRLVLVFAFAQGLHYASWLVWLPRATRPATTIRSDFGRIGFATLVIAALAVPALAFLDPIATRGGYLSLVLFHGWFELAVIVHLLLRTKPTAVPA